MTFWDQVRRWVRPGDRAGDPARWWGAKAAQRQDAARLAAVSWLDAPLVQREHLHPRISGSPEVNWFEWVVRTFFPARVPWACNIGCGDGGLERHAHALGLAERFDSFDLSEEAVALARRRAAEAGITGVTYQVADLNQLILPAARYQGVFASMALHHLENLEGVLDQVHQALAPGGWLVFNEFVGPTRFQWTDLQLAWINRLLALLPDRLRRDLAHPGQSKAPLTRPTVEEMIRIDPSEAVRSAEILPLVRERFVEVRLVPYGGTILHLLLDRIAGNFREESPEDRALLRLLCLLEGALVDSQTLPSDFVVGVFRRSDPSPA